MSPITNQIDINCDLGEGSTKQDCFQDKQLMQYISSCNIACGGHAGNNLTIKLSVKNAITSKITIGAHPGYPDKLNFGRKTLAMTDDSLVNSIREQVGRLQNEVSKHAIKLSHIKFHGALYNDIEENFSLAVRMVKLCKSHFPDMKLLGLANGHLQVACKEHSQGFISEGFMDRVYRSTGKLTPRSVQGSVIHEPTIAIQQALALAQKTPLSTSDGGELKMKVESICLHGDNHEALIIAKSLTVALKNVGILVSSNGIQ